MSPFANRGRRLAALRFAGAKVFRSLRGAASRLCPLDTYQGGVAPLEPQFYALQKNAVDSPLRFLFSPFPKFRTRAEHCRTYHKFIRESAAAPRCRPHNGDEV